MKVTKNVTVKIHTLHVNSPSSKGEILTAFLEQPLTVTVRHHAMSDPISELHQTWEKLSMLHQCHISTLCRFIVGSSELPPSIERDNNNHPTSQSSNGGSSPARRRPQGASLLSFLPPNLQAVVHLWRQSPKHKLCRHHHGCLASTVEVSQISFPYFTLISESPHLSKHSYFCLLDLNLSATIMFRGLLFHAPHWVINLLPRLCDWVTAPVLALLLWPVCIELSISVTQCL